MRKLMVGNWKMHGVREDLLEIAKIAQAALTAPAIEIGICLPATLIERATLAFPQFIIGAQDCHMLPSGAYTGCVSAAMLADAGAKMVIVGHSERRAAQGETDADVRGKAVAARQSGLGVIVCVGETKGQRDAGQAVAVVLDQLAGSIPDKAAPDWLNIAYEPIWAIGTGCVPSNEDVAQMHSAIRGALLARFGAYGQDIRILYGGSMNGDNALVLLAIENVDGGLVGGASLSAAKFAPILQAAQSMATY
jgi:triosephosphate isomerase (TIM)